MGHSEVSVGRGTVRMGRREVDAMGGSIGRGFVGAVSVLDFDSGSEGVGLPPGAASAVEEGGREGRMGGGRSIFSAAFRDNWRAKSDACHHSRNLSAKMEVGRRIFRLLRRRGVTLRARLRGVKRLPPSPGRAGPPRVGLLGELRAAMAAWSAAPRRRMRVPISQRKGEWYFVLSKR